MREREEVCMPMPDDPVRTECTGERPDPAVVRTAVRRLQCLERGVADGAEALAFLLCRVADADRCVSTEESACIEGILAALEYIEEDQAVLLAEIAKHRERLADCASAYRISRSLRERTSPLELATLLDRLVQVAAADGRVTAEEAGVVRQVAAELGFTRDDADSHLARIAPRL
jgi:uncharacterized tellurite resistance protein B-like protein